MNWKATAAAGACIVLAGCGGTEKESSSASKPDEPSTSECIKRWNRPGNEQVSWLGKTWKKYKLTDRARVWIGPSQVFPTRCATVVEIDPGQNYAILREHEEGPSWDFSPVPEEFTQQETVERREAANARGLPGGKLSAR